MNFKELRATAKMTQQQFSDFFNIPLKTIQNWEINRTKCADYLLELMEYKLKNEKIIK